MKLTVIFSAETMPDLDDDLRRLGIEVRHRPLLQFTPPGSWAPLDRALKQWAEYAAVAVTSPRAARALVCRHPLAGDPSFSRPPVIWTVGRATASALAALGPVEIPSPGGNGARLAPCGAEPRADLTTTLRHAGVEVDTVVCYGIRAADRAGIAGAMHGTDLILMASHRLIERAARIAGPGQRPALVCLGDATARTARAVEWELVAVAREPAQGDVVAEIRAIVDGKRGLDHGRSVVA